MNNYSDLKKSGFIPQRQNGFFSLRIKVVGGRLEAGQLTLLSRVAETYGRGHVHLTSRQGLEIPFIRLESVEKVRDELTAGAQFPASMGPGLRTMTACQGASVCPSGLVLPQDMVETLDRELDGAGLPHKFKIGLTGCPNNCLKAEENDIGLKGGLIPIWALPDQCTFCGLCQKVCPVGAIVVKDESLEYDIEKCVYCGRCFTRCPQKCWNGRAGWHLYFGGLFGNQIQLGRRLLPIVTEDCAALNLIRGALDYYRLHGRPRERFGLTIERLGWDSFENYMRDQ